MKKSLCFLCAAPGALPRGSELDLALTRSCRALVAKGKLPRAVLVTQPALQPAANVAAGILGVKAIAPVCCAPLKDHGAVASAVSVADDVAELFGELLKIDASLATGSVIVSNREDILDIAGTLLLLAAGRSEPAFDVSVIEGNLYLAEVRLDAARVVLSRYSSPLSRWEGVTKVCIDPGVRRSVLIR